MKKYDVYGIGNALVDIEVQVQPQFFEELKIHKGVMTLIEQKRQKEILSKINGQALKKASGGSAANSMLTIAQFGGNSYYACKVADDDLGDFFHADLLRGGVETNGSIIRDKGDTGTCLVMVTPDADRTMNTYLGITEHFGIKELEEDVLRNSEFIYIEGYLLAQQTGRKAISEALKMAQKYNLKKVLSFSDPFIVSSYEKEMKDIIDHGMDLIFCNEDEAKMFAGTNDTKTASDKLKHFTKNFVITLGAEGSLIYDGEEQRYYKIEGHKINAVDTTGAGDVYAGAFIYAITHQYSTYAAGRLASLSSAKVVSRYGPRLTQAEVCAAIREVPKS
ncbi:MAG: adenosine kinase [Oligoflexia bacterium]|nr:adenosine kinase [Oligoflexia bacterium]